MHNTVMVSKLAVILTAVFLFGSVSDAKEWNLEDEDDVRELVTKIDAAVLAAAIRASYDDAIKRLKKFEDPNNAGKLSLSPDNFEEVGELLKRKEQGESLIKAIGPELMKAAEEPEEDPPPVGNRLRITGGLMTLAPYSVVQDSSDPSMWMLDTSDSGRQTKTFIEAAYRHRWAWNARNTDTGLLWIPAKGKKGGGALSGLIGNRWLDHDMKLGFIVDSSDENDEISGSTIAGSGDFYAQYGVGFPIWRDTVESDVVGDQEPVRYAISLELGLGGVTESGVQDIHDYQYVGIGSTWGIPMNGKLAEVAFLGSISRRETPALIGDTTMVSTRNNLPEFEDETLYGLAAEFRLPLENDRYLMLSGELYNGTKGPNPWSVQIGYQIPFPHLKDFVPAVLGGSGAEKSDDEN